MAKKSRKARTKRTTTTRTITRTTTTRLTKTDLVKGVVGSCDMTQQQAVACLNCLFSKMQAHLGTRGRSIMIKGFGTFRTVYRKPRIGINPKTGNKIKIQGRNVTKFKASKTINKK